MELPQYMFHLLKKEGFLACIIVMPSVYPPGNERIYVVDALRGFAVMAIMLLHFLEHFIYNSYPVASSPMMEAANQQFKEVFFFLFAGKSYTIFALLFGFTFAVQYRNQARKGRDFAGRFVWRMCLLAVFACMNAAFFPGRFVAGAVPPVEDILAGGFVPVFPGPAAGVGLCGGAVDASGLGSSLPVCCGIVRFPEIRRGYGKFLGDGLGEPDYRTMGQPGMGY